MPRFCANLSLMFTEVPFPERFDAAARAGFKGVEFQFPYEHEAALLAERARGAAVEVVLFNLPPGDFAKGERGIACLPSRMSEFRDGVARAIHYAQALGCRQINMLSGIAPQPAKGAPIAPEKLRETFVSNLRYASGELKRAGIRLMIEAISTRAIPGFYVRHSTQVLSLIDEAAVDNAWLQYDWFHMQAMEGDLAKTMEAQLARIGHMQFADSPDRHEPGTGELNLDFLFRHADRLGYTGWIGAEYIPSGRTEDSLGWLRPWLQDTESVPA